MKHIRASFLIMLFLVMTGCSGSDVYRGSWKATDLAGNKMDISFDEKMISIKDANGKLDSFSYTQNSIHRKKSERHYGIRLSDGRAFTIFFPTVKDPSKGLITLRDGQPVYVICRNTYLSYEEVIGLTK